MFDIKRALMKIVDKEFKPLIGHESKVIALDLIFFILSEIQVTYMILSIAIHNSAFLNTSHSNFMLDQEKYSFFFNLGFESSFEVPEIITVGIYFGIITIAGLNLQFHKKAKWPAVVSNLLAALHRDFLSIVFHQILVFGIYASENSTYKLVAILMCVFNGVTGFIAARLCYSPFEKTYFLSQSSSNLYIITYIFRFVGIFFEYFIQSSFNQIIKILLFTGYITLCVNELAKLPCYQYSTMIFLSFFKTVELGCLIGVIARWAYDGSTNFCFFVSIIVSVLLCGIVFSTLEKYMQSMFEFGLSRIKTISDFETRVMAVDYYTRKGCKLKVETKQDVEQILFMSHYSKYHPEITITLMQNSNFEAISRLYMKALDSLKLKKPRVIIQKCLHDMSYGLRLNSSLLFEISKLLRSHNLEDRIIAQRIFDKITKSNLDYLRQEKNLFIMEVMKYFDNRHNLIIDIEHMSHNYLKYWETFVSKPNLRELFRQSEKLNSFAKKIEKNWIELNDINKANIKLEATLYSSYLNLIRCCPFTSLKILQQFKKMKNSTTQEFSKLELSEALKYEGSIAVVAFENSHDELQIDYVSREIIELGYDHQEARGKSLTYILPNFYKKENLLSYLEKNKQAENNYLPIFVQSKAGFISVRELFYSYTTIVNDALQYLFVFTAVPNENEYIIHNVEGDILFASETLYKALQLSNKSKHRVEDIAVDLHAYKQLMAHHEAQIKGKFQTKLQMNEKNPEVKLRILSKNVDLSYKALINRFSFKDLFIMTLSKISNDIDEPMEENFGMVEEKSYFLMPDLTRSKVKNSINPDPFSQQTDSNVTAYNHKNMAKQSENSGLTGQSIKQREDRVLEKAVHASYTLKRDNYFKYAAWFQIIACLGMLLGFTVHARSQLDILPSIYFCTTYLLNRNFYLWIWSYWNSQNYILMIKELLIDRIELTRAEFWAFLIVTSAPNAEAILKADYNILQTYPLFEPATQRRFEQPIRMFLRENRSQIYQVNIFEFDRIYSSSSFRLQTFSPDDPYALKADNPDLQLTLYTVKDDQLIVQEDLMLALGEDISIKVDGLTDSMTAILSTVICLGAVMLTWFIIVEFVYHISKRHFVEALFQIRENEIRPEISRVRSFLSCVRDIKKNEEAILGIVQQSTQNFKKDFVEKSTRRVFKTNEEEFSKHFLITLFLIFFVQIALLFMSLSIVWQIQDIKSLILQKIDQAIRLNILYGDFNVIFITLFEYIQGTNPTLRNKPFSEEYAKDLKACSESSAFYYSLLETMDQDLVDKIKPIYTGDLCELVLGGKGCIGVTREKMKDGLIAANALVVDAARTIKTSYDLSNKTYEAVHEILYMDKYIDIEYAMWIYVSPANTVIQEALSEMVVRTIDRSRKKLEDTIIGIIVGFCLFFCVFWKLLWDKVMKERNMVSSMMKQIPKNVAKNNFYVKNFINRYSNMSN